jgi:hypothetical protein
MKTGTMKNVAVNLNEANKMKGKNEHDHSQFYTRNI